MSGISYRPPNLLHLPLEVLLKIAEFLSFADLWYLAICSHHCKAIAHQIIWHRYRIDLSKKQLPAFELTVHAALAYVSRHGYKANNSIDHTIIQSVANRLVVEIYDRTPLKNWQHSLDFLLDKTLGIIIDHVFLDPLLDIVPKHSSYNNNTKAPYPLLSSEFHPTRMGRLITNFLTTMFPTMMALFETEPTTEIHHRLLVNHINRHLDNLTSRYHSHHKRSLLLITSPGSARSATVASTIHQHNQLLRLNFRILIRLIGTLVQTDLLSANDLDIITRQRVQFFFLTSSSEDDYPRKKRTRYTRKIQKEDQVALYESLKNHATQYCWQMWLEEIEFQMEIFLDLTRAVLLLQEQTSQSRTDLNVVSTLLDNTVSALITTRSNENSIQPNSTATV
ncbi:uncharacterized protein B0P05DRAFT_532498 [Gilbertella persicaria]|uniref:uncharacterized protein n=1 Tax=Gilbertella persicaria TaxID=101096 RepID=UPI00221E9A74|nr:uncharacterized protein B0P05DRAFT_532498 [Gilbertella persicaria]KAI8086819.1 hypothetical protein B0P05DRAFT_532498 [Gilbertella persicaria]